jgi:hypothetical protein
MPLEGLSKLVVDRCVTSEMCPSLPCVIIYSASWVETRWYMQHLNGNNRVFNVSIFFIKFLYYTSLLKLQNQSLKLVVQSLLQTVAGEMSRIINWIGSLFCGRAGRRGGGGGRNLCGGGGKCPTSKFINFSNLVRLFNTSNLSKFCN